MVYNTRNRSNDTIESQKEKKEIFNAHAGGKWNLTVQCIVNKQIWKVHILGIRYGQYNISDIQALFWCSVIIILEMTSLNTLFLCSAGQ